MLKFSGLIFLSDYNIRKSERDCWNTGLNLRCDLFPETMTRNRFFEMKSALHVADIQSLIESRMAKVEQLHTLLNKKLIQLVFFTKILV